MPQSPAIRLVTEADLAEAINAIEFGEGTFNTIITGSATPPSEGVGSNGDYYINPITKTLYGPKNLGSWPAGVSLVGPAGDTGAPGAASTVPGPPGPAGPVSALGDVIVLGFAESLPPGLPTDSIVVRKNL